MAHYNDDSRRRDEQRREEQRREEQRREEQRREEQRREEARRQDERRRDEQRREELRRKDEDCKKEERRRRDSIASLKSNELASHLLEKKDAQKLFHERKETDKQEYFDKKDYFKKKDEETEEYLSRKEASKEAYLDSKAARLQEQRAEEMRRERLRRAAIDNELWVSIGVQANERTKRDELERIAQLATVSARRIQEKETLQVEHLAAVKRSAREQDASEERARERRIRLALQEQTYLPESLTNASPSFRNEQRNTVVSTSFPPVQEQHSHSNLPGKRSLWQWLTDLLKG